MVESLEILLSSMEYPGRFIILGRDSRAENDIIVYGITGRSQSSQARRLVFNGELFSPKISVEPTDEKQLKEEDKDLLIYDAITLEGRTIVVSNGEQTNKLHDVSLRPNILSPIYSILQTHFDYEYEPDPNFTPRISGVIHPEMDAALGIIKRAVDGSPVRHYFEIPLIPGRGGFISTYAGQNKNPLPSFIGEPIEVDLRKYRTPERLAQVVYDELNSDYRVAVAAVFKNQLTGENEIKIINRHGDKK